LRLRPRFVDRDRPPADLVLVELRDRGARAVVGLHFDERESAGPAGGHVTHDAHRLDRSGLGEQRLEISLAGVERQIAYE
jgi:hypothetical protein